MRDATDGLQAFRYGIIGKQVQVLYDPVTVSAEPAAIYVTGLLAGKAAEGKDAQVRRPALAKSISAFCRRRPRGIGSMRTVC